MRETGRNGFKAYLMKKLKSLYPEAIITLLDPQHINDIPDVIVLYKNKWATLECKGYRKAHVGPNQAYYVDVMNNMSFSAFVYPENEEIFLEALHDFLTN